MNVDKSGRRIREMFGEISPRYDFLNHFLSGGVMGALNIVGTIGSGWLCDRFGPKTPLICFYLLRGLSLVLLPMVGTAPGLFGFAAAYGLNYISTVPATTAMTARLFGRSPSSWTLE